MKTIWFLHLGPRVPPPAPPVEESGIMDFVFLVLDQKQPSGLVCGMEHLGRHPALLGHCVAHRDLVATITTSWSWRQERFQQGYLCFVASADCSTQNSRPTLSLC